MRHEPEWPSQASLDTLFTDAHFLRITLPNLDDAPDITLLEVRGDDVRTVRDMLCIHEHEYSSGCYCIGAPWIEIHDETGLRAVLAIHHALTLEYEGRWRWHGRLVDGLALHRWLAERGVREPLEYEERENQRAEARESAYRAWLAAAPPCLDASRFANGNTHPDVYQAALHTLESAYPRMDDRVHALLSWYSVSGGDNWMSVPSYELAPESLLEILGVSAVSQALEGEGLSTMVVLGAARFYATSRDAKRALAMVPEPLWALMLEATASAAVAENVQLLTKTIAERKVY